MGMGPFNPDCLCCDEITCNDWANSAPASIQLTLPATCERAGTHVLSSTPQEFNDDCPESTLAPFAVDTLCASWKIEIGSGAAIDTIIVSVFIDAFGDTFIIAGVCNELGSAGHVQDAGNLWGVDANAFTDWDELDGLSLPWTNRVVDTEGMADCTGSPPANAVISFVP
jgi:hypothetical protein